MPDRPTDYLPPPPPEPLRRLIVTLHFPLNMGTVARILEAIARDYPGAIGENGEVWDVTMTSDHDPLAEAFDAVGEGKVTPDRIRAALDAAGYEVRPKLTAERLAAALEAVPWDDYTRTTEVTTPEDAPNRVYDSEVDMAAFAAAILAALDDAP
jgi:hypothetical protein